MKCIIRRHRLAAHHGRGGDGHLGLTGEAGPAPHLVGVAGVVLGEDEQVGGLPLGRGLGDDEGGAGEVRGS